MLMPGAALLAPAAAFGLAMSLAFSFAAQGQDADPPALHAIVEAPACTTPKGEPVLFIESSQGSPDMAAGMAVRDADGRPVVFRSNYAAVTSDFQRFIDRHECAHHQTGDVDRPHPPRNSADHLMNESISDCIAILRLRDEEGYDRAGFDRVAAALRREMAKIGFPEISISSRISNIETCYGTYGPPADFVAKILKRRGQGR
ncbi:MAG: hypothetical protein HQ483_06370 [Rhodospirillales bacterium]|nr:hypothetical protein [Rhodospirillales bacterium]